MLCGQSSIPAPAWHVNYRVSGGLVIHHTHIRLEEQQRVDEVFCNKIGQIGSQCGHSLPHLNANNNTSAQQTRRHAFHANTYHSVA